MTLSISVTGLPTGNQRPYTLDTRRPGTVHIDVPTAGPGGVRPVYRRPRIGLSAKTAEYRWHDKLPGAAFGRAFAGPGDGLLDWKSPAVTGLTSRGITAWVSAKDRAPAAAYRRQFDGIPAGTELWITHHHEPIADGTDPHAYDDEYRLIRQVADDHPNRARIRIMSILEAYAARFKRLDWAAYLAVEHVDAIAFDCYWREDMDYEAPESLIGMPALVAAEYGMPWHIAELGASTSCEGRDRWYPEVVDAAALQGCQSIGLWCSRKTIQDKQDRQVELEYRPVDAPTAAAFRELLAGNETTGGARA